MKKLKYLLLIAIVIFTSCGKKKEENKIKEIIKPVVVQKAENRVMNQIFRSDAIFTPENVVEHRTEKGGTIEKILKKNGDFVKKGELVMVLKDEPTKAAYYTAKANYLSAQSTYKIAYNNYKKFKTLYSQELVSYLEYVNYENNYIKAEGNLKSSKANYENLKSDFDKLNRRADISGVIGNLFGKLGEKVEASTNLFTVINDKNMETYIGFPAEWLNEINVGQEVKVKVPDISKTFVGKITEINPIAEKDTKKFMIKILVDNKDNLIKDGMYSFVTVPSGQRDGLSIQDEAIFVRNLLSYVFKVENGKAKRVEVKLGATNLPYTQISSPELKPGDDIVVKGVFGLEDGERVEEVKE